MRRAFGVLSSSLRPPLASTQLEISTRIEELGASRRINESATKTWLIGPALDALGWDVRDVDDA